MADEAPAGIDFREYLAIVRRHILVIVILTVALGAAGYAYASSKTPMYEASSTLLYQPQLDISNPLGGTTYSDSLTQELQMQSAVTIIGSPAMAQRVRGELSKTAQSTPYGVTATIGASDAAASTGVDNILTVSATSPDPDVAAEVANEYAQQFTAYRVQQVRDQITAAEQVITQKLKEFQTPAQRTLSDYTLLSERLRDLEILSATATGNFEFVIHATAPGAPYAPRPMRTAMMGAVGGFILGILYAFLREKLDTRLHNYREVGEIMRLPVVGRVPLIPPQSLHKGPLVVVTEAEGRAAESLRALRGNIEFVNLGEENRVLMVVSAQKGEGKSLVIANLAMSLALTGKKVVLVDADLRRPRVHALFGTPNTKGVSSVVAGISELDDTLQVISPAGTVTIRSGGNGQGPNADADTYGEKSKLWLLTSGPIPPNPGEMVASARFQNLVESLKAMPFDFILVDSPAFMSVGDTTALAASVDGLLVLVNMSKTRRPVLEEARDSLELLAAPKLGVVTVADRTVGEERYHYYSRA